MPNFLAELGDTAAKALAPIATNLALFAPSSRGAGVYNSASFIPLDGQGGVIYGGGNGGVPDFDKLLGDPMNNSVAAAAVNVVSQAVTEATLVLEQRKESDKWERVFKHPAIAIFDAHPDISQTELWEWTESRKVTGGWCPWIVVYNESGTTPVQLMPWYPSKVTWWGDDDSLIAGYDVQSEKGDITPMSRKQIIHFRHSLGWDFRGGYTPLFAGKESMVGSRAATTYTTALVLNCAVSSWLVSVEQSTAQGAASNVTPGQFQVFIDEMRRKYTRNKQGVGGIDGINLPLKITRMAYSPNEMSIDKLKDEYATDIHALIGVSKKLTGHGADPTYLNLAEAIKDFWVRRMKPACNKNADTLNRQLLPLFGLDPADWRYRFDYSKVSGLQESQDAIIQRWKGVFDSGGMDLYSFQDKLNIPDIPDDYKNLFAKVPQMLGGASEENTSSPDTSETKRFNPEEARDHGRWTSGGGTAGKGQSANRVGLRAASDSERKEHAIPPAWTDVQISTDPKSDVTATGKDKKGRLQVRYSDAYAESQKGAKWGRIEAFHERRPALIKAINEEIASGGKNAHQAMTLRLIAQTGLRNGGDEGGGNAKAYGASNLLTSHARVEGDTVHLDFIGKEGVRQRHTFTDPVLARHIEARQASGKETVFDGDSGKTLAYLKKISGGDFKVHDFRTHYGTVLGHAVAKRLIDKGHAPTTEKELASFKLRVAKVVSRDLGNGASMARDNYIHPNVFAGAENGVKRA